MNPYRSEPAPTLVIRVCRSCRGPVSHCRCRSTLLIGVLTLLFAFGASSACSVLPTLTRATGSAAIVVSGAYRALDRVDAEEIGKIQALAKAGKPEEATAALNAYLPKYKAARLAVDSAEVAVETAAASIPAIKLAKNGSKDALQRIAVLAKAVADVVKACDALGLKLPGVTL